MRTYVFTTREVTVLIQAPDLFEAERILDRRIHELAEQGIRIPNYMEFHLQDSY